RAARAGARLDAKPPRHADDPVARVGQARLEAKGLAEGAQGEAVHLRLLVVPADGDVPASLEALGEPRHVLVLRDRRRVAPRLFMSAGQIEMSGAALGR